MDMHFKYATISIQPSVYYPFSLSLSRPHKYLRVGEVHQRCIRQQNTSEYVSIATAVCTSVARS
jgi:hypothetical protein